MGRHSRARVGVGGESARPIKIRAQGVVDRAGVARQRNHTEQIDEVYLWPMRRSNDR